jgi:hypothetical protein
LNECLGLGSLFCSSVQNNEEEQSFKVYFIGYFGEIFKTMSIITTLLFSIERYRITTDSKNRLIQKLAQANIYSLTATCFFISFLTCTNKLFEYRLNGWYYSGTEYPDLNMILMFDEPLKNWWFFSIYSFHYFLNDVLFLLINFFVDLFLVKNIRQNLKKKKEILKKSFESTKANSQHQQSIQARKSYLKKMEKINAAEKNTNRMIIFTLIVYAFCRLPELFCYLVLIIQVFPEETIYYTYGPLMINLIQCMFVLSYSTNFFFYFKFNKTFNEGFKEFFSFIYSKNHLENKA